MIHMKSEGWLFVVLMKSEGRLFVIFMKSEGRSVVLLMMSKGRFVCDQATPLSFLTHLLSKIKAPENCAQNLWSPNVATLGLYQQHRLQLNDRAVKWIILDFKRKAVKKLTYLFWVEISWLYFNLAVFFYEKHGVLNVAVIITVALLLPIPYYNNCVG